MDTVTCSMCRLAVPPRNNSIAHAPSRCTTGLVAEVGGSYTGVTDDEVIAAALRILASRVAHSQILNQPRVIREYLALRFAGLEHEVFTCVFLNRRLHVIECEDMFRGTIDSSVVHPREILKRALALNAAAVIVAHNHPSGVADPSEMDLLITKMLVAVLTVCDIRLIDHLVVAADRTVSLAERGYL